MANEFIIRKGYKSLAASEVTGSLKVDGLVEGTSLKLSNGFTISEQSGGYAALNNWVKVDDTGFYTTTNINMDLDDSTSIFRVRGTGNSTLFKVDTSQGSGKAFFYKDVRLSHEQNAGSRLELYNNRQDASNVEIYRIAAYNSAEVAGIHFYRGGGGSSGYTKVFAKRNNASNLEVVAQFGANDSKLSTFAGNINLTGGGTIEAPSVSGGEKLTLKAAGGLDFIIDSNGNGADDQYFKVMKHTNTEIFSVKETGETNFLGAVTASAFTGDGSGLTGVTAEWDGSHTGNASITGNLTIGGNVTVDNPLNYQFNLASNALITPSYTNAVSTPFGNTWHDTLAFQRNYTVTQETSTDNSSWTSVTTTAGLFVQKDKTSHTVIGNGVRSVRWTFTGVAYNVARFIHIAAGYSSPTPSCAVTIEYSSDNTNWTTIHTSTGVSFSASNRYYTVNPYIGNGGRNYCRITIDKGNTDTKVVRLASLKMLTQRLGDQGKGREDELPFLWDDNKKITLEGGATTNSNSTVIGSRKFVARDSNGTGLFADDASSGLSIADNGNATFSGDVNLGTGKNIYLSGTSGLRFVHDGSNGNIINATGDLKISSEDSNRDIIFRGKDGASTITALTLDMSEGGNATFAGRVMSDTHFQSSDTNATLSATGTGNVYLRPNGYSSTTGQVHINSSGNATFTGTVELSSNKSVNWPGGSIRAEGNTLKLTATTLIDLQEDTQIQGGLDIKQTSDSDGLQIFGYDDRAAYSGNLYIDGSGNFQIRQTHGAGSGYIQIHAENYLELGASSLIYTQANFRIYDAGQLSFGSGGDYKIEHNPTPDNLVIHTDDNKGITIDNAGNVTFTEDVVVAGTITAQEFHTEFVSASIMYESGSTKFGDTADDIHSFTGSVNVDGNVGIGTSSPGASLHVASTSNDYVAKFSHSTATGYAPGSILLQAGQGTSRGQGLYHYNTEADENWFTGVPYNVSSKKWIIANKYSTTQEIDTAQLSHALLTVDSDTGNVGIGTTTIAQKLHVVGNQVRLDTAAGGYYLHNSSGTFRGAFHDNGTTTNIFGDGNGSTPALSIESNNVTFAGRVDSQVFSIDGASVASYQDFQSKPIDTDSGMFTVGGHGEQGGYSRAVSLWTSHDGSWNSWVGTNLRWDGTNFKRASDNGSQNWGNIAGIRFLGNSGTSGAAMKFIIDPPEQSNAPSGEQTIGTSLPSSMTALSLNNDLSATFAGNITFGDGHFIGDDASDNLLIQGSASENIIIDSADDIILDAGGGDIKLKDDATQFAKFTKSGDDFHIVATRSDGDIKFFGSDGGTSVTALTLDMSEGGSATFAGKVRANSWFQGADGTNTLWANSTSGVMIQTPGSTANNNDSKIYFRNSGTTIKHTFDTNTGNATFAGKITAAGDPGVVVTGSGNSTIHVASTGTGLAGMYMDASNGDFAGSDYVFIGQDNDKTFRLESFNSSGDIVLRESNTNTLRLSGGNATFAGTVLIDGVSNYTGLTVKGSGASRPAVNFTNATQGNLGTIFGTEARAVSIGTGATGVIALTLDAQQYATFATRVGIGVAASTNAMLDVKGPDTDNAVLGRFWSNTGARGSFIIRNGTSVSPTTFIGTAGGSEELSIGTNNTEAIRIDASSTPNATFAGDILMPTAGQQLRIGSFTDGSSNNGEYANDDLVIGDGSISIYPHRRGDYGLNESSATSTTFRSKLNIWSDNEDHITFGGANTHMVSAWETWKIWINNDSAQNGIFKLYHTNAKTEFARFSGDGTTSFITGKFNATKELTVSSIATTNGSPATNNISVSGYGMIGNRGSVYLTNANTDSTASVQIGVGGAHAVATKLLINPSNSIFSTNVRVGADSTYSLGTSAARWANVYADFYYGDGSNLTNIAYTETDTLDTVADRGATTNQALTIGASATNGGRVLSQNYSGTNRLGVISSHASSGNFLIGYGAEGKVSSSGNFVSTYGNFSGGHAALSISGTHLRWYAEASNSNTTIGDDLTLANVFSIDRSGNLTLSGTVDGVDIAALPTTFAPTNAEQNVQSDWNATSGDALILNKPTIPTDHGDHDGLYLPLGGGALTGNVTSNSLITADLLRLTNDATDTTRHRISVYDSGATSYGMMLWNSNGTSGDWATMIYGPNQSNRRISFGKANANFATNNNHAGVDELAWLDLDNGNYFTDGNIYPGGSTTKYVSTGRIDNWNTAYNHSQATHAPTDAEANVQSDWNETTTTSDAFILNKPTIPTDFVSKTNGGTFSGDITISKSVGDSVLTIEADTDNNNENDNPRIELKQDSGVIYGHFGLNGDANGAFTGAGANSTYIRSAGNFHVATNGSTHALEINTSQNATFAGNVSVGSNKYTLTVNAPTNLVTSIVNDTINVTFTASTTSNIDNYLVFSSVAGGDYGLISVIPPADFGATMSIIDDSFNAGGTQAYRIYAVKNGVYSSALTGTKSFTVGTVEPTNLSVVNLNTAFYIQYDAPSSKGRFITAYNIYKHEHATQSSLDRSSATLIYSGMNNSYMYQISGNNNDNFHKFWVETTVA